MSRTPARLGVAALAAGAALLVAAPALAHVSVSSTDATKEGYGKATFRVPNESDAASTTKVEVTLPEDTPFAFVTAQDKPGWEVDVETATLDEPVTSGDATLTEAVRTVTWTAEEGVGIAPGEFDEFAISGRHRSWRSPRRPGATRRRRRRRPRLPPASRPTASPGRCRWRRWRWLPVPSLWRCGRIDVVRRALVVVALVALVWAPVSAGAHAALVGSDPDDGAVLETAPSSVSLEFSEPVTRSDVALTAPDGSSVGVDVSSRDRVVTAAVRGADQRGTYTMSYRVVSADGHPIAGSRTFEVTTGRAVEQVDQAGGGEGFVQRHSRHVVWAVVAAVVAALLILWPVLRRKQA